MAGYTFTSNPDFKGGYIANAALVVADVVAVALLWATL